MPAQRPWWILTVALWSFALVVPARAAEPPAAPAKLAAPNLLSPLPGTKLGFANPVFYWAPIEGAASYVVELCRDEPCGTVLERTVLDASPLGNEPQWRPKPLTPGTLYWRVTARNRAGLDGQPSGAGQLDILSDQLDHEPPVAKLAISGPQAQVGGRLFTPPAPSLEVSAQDAGCGLYIAAPEIQGSVETPGDHKVSGYAIDRCGNRVDLPPLAFTVDAEAPVVRSGLVDEPKPGAPGETGLYGSADGRRWQPLWRPGMAEAAAAKDAKPEAANEIAGDRPRLLLATRGVKLTIDGKTVAPGKGQVLAVSAEDAGAGVGKLTFHTVAAGPGGAPALALEIEAVDRVGNRRKVDWPLVLP